MGSFTVRPSVFPVIPAESGIPSLRMGFARPYLVVNRILIYSGGLGLPHHKVGVLVPAYFLHYFPAQRYSRLVLNAKKAVGTVPTGRHGAKYTVLLTLLLNNN